MAIRFISRSILGMAALGIISGSASAQSGGKSGIAAPEGPSAAVKYESAFSDYKPFQEQKLRSWKEVNKEVGDNPMGHDMGAMKGMPGKAGTPGHDMGAMKGMPAEAGTPGHDMGAMKGMPTKAGTPGHDMGAMKGMPAKAGIPGHDMGAMKGMPAKAGTPGHDMGAMKGMPAKAGTPGHDMGAMNESARKQTALAMTGATVAPGRMALPRAGNITGTGIVQAIDKANARVRLAHDPIVALNWPKLTLFFRLKDRALAERVKEGERVGFTLENSASGFVISDFHATPAKGNAK